MNEAEWLACTDPTPMLEFLRGKGSDRRLRLFACACCRRIWLRREAASAPKAVEISERFADGTVTGQVVRTFLSHLGAMGGISAAWAANCAEFDVLRDDAHVAATEAVKSALWFAYLLVCEQTFSRSTYTGDEAKAAVAREKERQELPALILDIFSNPFRPQPTIDPCWLAWNDSAIPKLAQSIYDGRRFADLPLLADALEEAGCTVADILDHCRSRGEHVRGCWVVDLILGKE